MAKKKTKIGSTTRYENFEYDGKITTVIRSEKGRARLKRTKRQRNSTNGNK